MSEKHFTGNGNRYKGSEIGAGLVYSPGTARWLECVGWVWIMLQRYWEVKTHSDLRPLYEL